MEIFIRYRFINYSFRPLFVSTVYSLFISTISFVIRFIHYSFQPFHSLFVSFIISFNYYLFHSLFVSFVIRFKHFIRYSFNLLFVSFVFCFICFLLHLFFASLNIGFNCNSFDFLFVVHFDRRRDVPQVLLGQILSPYSLSYFCLFLFKVYALRFT